MVRRALLRILSRLGLLVLGVVFALVLLEAGLHVLAAIWGGDRLTSMRSDGEQVRILCLGDSHTYGVYFPAEQSYPSQLKRLLNEGLEKPRFVVINAGSPGRSAAQMAKELPDLLTRYHPHLVLALGGLNDGWNEASRADLEVGTGRRSLWQFVRERSRLVRLFAIVEEHLESSGPSDLSDPDVSPLERLDSGRPNNLADLQVRRTVDLALERVVEVCERADAIPILMTYAPSTAPFTATQLGIRDAAARTQASLIDHQARFAEAMDQGRGADLLVENDWHPTPRGAALMADEIVRRLCELQLVDHAPVGGELPPAPVEPESLELRIATRSDNRGKRSLREFQIEGMPNRRFHLMFASSTSPPIRLFRLVIPLARDKLFTMSATMPCLGGRLDEHGHATVCLDSYPLSRLSRTKVYVAAVTFVDDDELRHRRLTVNSVSRALDLTP